MSIIDEDNKKDFSDFSKEQTKKYIKQLKEDVTKKIPKVIKKIEEDKNSKPALVFPTYVTLKHCEEETYIKQIFTDLFNSNKISIQRIATYFEDSTIKANQFVNSYNNSKDLTGDKLMTWLNIIGYDVALVDREVKINLPYGDFTDSFVPVYFEPNENYGKLKELIRIKLNEKKLTIGQLKTYFGDGNKMSNKINAFKKSADGTTSTLLEWCDIVDLDLVFVKKQAAYDVLT